MAGGSRRCRGGQRAPDIFRHRQFQRPARVFINHVQQGRPPRFRQFHAFPNPLIRRCRCIFISPCFEIRELRLRHRLLPADVLTQGEKPLCLPGFLRNRRNDLYKCAVKARAFHYVLYRSSLHVSGMVVLRRHPAARGIPKDEAGNGQ